MKKIINNNKGFTLTELVVAGGIATVIGVIAFSSLRTTRQASNITVVGSEVSTLKSLMVAQLANPDSCKKTFPTDTLVERASGVQIIAASNAVLVREGLTFGPVKEFSVTNISTTSPNLASNILKIKVDYDFKESLDRAGKKAKSFEIEIFVNKDTATRTKINGCFSDMSGVVRRAIEQGCKGQGAVYDPGAGQYGTCTHILPVMRDSGGTVYTSLCPAGQYLKAVETQASNLVFTCAPFSVPICPGGDWTYIREIAAGTAQPNCITLSTYFPTGTVFGTRVGNAPTVYRPVTLACTDPDYVLRKLNDDYTLDCVPKQINQGCPVDEYIKDIIVNANHTYSLDCEPMPKTNTSSACPAGQFLRKVNANGNFPADACAAPVIPATCPVGQVIVAIDTNGVATCQAI